MQVAEQLDMFAEMTSEDRLNAKYEALSESHHAVRKKVFGQLGSISKMVMDQQAQIEYLLAKLNLACPLEKSQ